MLSALANSLLDGTVFDIVQSLKEVQYLEEKALCTQRLRLVNEHRGMISLNTETSESEMGSPGEKEKHISLVRVAMI